MAQCDARADDGLPCLAPAMDGEAYCYFHNPRLEVQRADAASRGGRAPRNRADLTKALARPEILDDPMRVAAVLENLISGVVSGKVSASTLKSVAYSSRVLLSALEQGDLRKELEDLRAAVKRLEGAGYRVTP